MFRQNHPPQPQAHCENFHLVGQSMSVNPMCSPSPNVHGTPTPVASTNIEESANLDTNRAAKMNNKRYWTHEEEERLVITVQFHVLYVILFGYFFFMLTWTVL
jgi:hypothetical protein